MKTRFVPAAAIVAPSVQPSPGAAQAQPVKTPVIKVESQKSASKVKSNASVTRLSRKEGISFVERQLIAFFWLGLNLNDEHVEIERTLFANLLPIDGIFAVSNIVNQIFWQPFFNHCKEPCENIYNIFTNEYLPIMKQTLSAPAVLRRSPSPRRIASPRRSSGTKRGTTTRRSSGTKRGTTTRKKKALSI
jgi:hypothetical protein